jgi:hypothetical protein
MRRIVILGVAMVAAFAVVAVDAISVSASGEEFVASKAGKIKSKGSTAQKFKTSAGTIECKEVTGSSEVGSSELKSVTHKEVLTFGTCKGFGDNVTISAAHLELNANGSAKLEKRVILTPEGAGCEVLIEPQTLENFVFSNAAGGKVSIEPKVTKIRSLGTGGACGGENTEGSYSGTLTSELEGGTVEWKS